MGKSCRDILISQNTRKKSELKIVSSLFDVKHFIPVTRFLSAEILLPKGHFSTENSLNILVYYGNSEINSTVTC